MSAETQTYKLSDTLPVNAPDGTFVSHYTYLIRQNPAWLLGLKRENGAPYYTGGQGLSQNDKRQAVA